MKIRSRRRHRSLKIWLPIILLAVLGLGAFSPNAFRSASHYLGAPIWAARDSMADKIGDKLRFAGKNKDEIIEENFALMEEFEALHKEVGLLRREVEVLKSTGSSASDDADLYPVLLKPPFTSYGLLIISLSGTGVVREGDAVSSLSGVFLGEVTEVLDGTARVRISSSPGNKLVSVAPNGEAVELTGQGGGSFALTLPKGVQVAEGDVFREALTGMVAARVEKIDESIEDPFNQIYLSMPENIFSIRSVHIMTQ